ncbi:MAG TPA: potassium/proton antiporter [Candidatus Sulfotelmatobacter sp.]|nr:potassium/proton antiporter [Candidatus Sulfotelmatobacter sp.]
MQASHELILLGSALVLLSIFAGLFSARFGAPLLLVFLGLGMLAGEEGPGGIRFVDFQAAYLIGSAALAVILFDGGLRAERDAVARALWPALLLATVGVLATAAVVGLATVGVFSVSWPQGLLIGATVASTDAAAVIALLHLRKLDIHARVSATLELESGLNDPVAISLTVLLVDLLFRAHLTFDAHLLVLFAIEMGGGTLLGVGGGYLILWLVNRLDAASGLYPILALAGALFLFGAAQTVGASGFLAVYLAGLIIGRRRHRASQVINRFLDGFAWLSQIVLFLMLGLLVSPSALLPMLIPALVVAVVLMLVARPFAVWLCLLPFRFSKRERLFIAWVGLRGAVPIYLATIPVLAGAPGAPVFFSIAFIVVMVSLTVQGWTVAPLARLLKLDLPPQETVPRLDIDLPTHLERDNAVAGYRLEPRSVAVGRRLAALPLPPGARLLALIRDGAVSTGETAPTLASGDYLLMLARPDDLALLDRVLGPKPMRSDAEERGVFGEFAFPGSTTLGSVLALYGAAATDVAPDATLAAYVARRLPRRPEIGDRVAVGGIELVVRTLEDGRIAQVGIELEPGPEARRWERPRALLADLRAGLRSRLRMGSP